MSTEELLNLSNDKQLKGSNLSDDEKAEIRKYSEDIGLPYEFIRFSKA